MPSGPKLYWTFIIDGLKKFPFIQISYKLACISGFSAFKLVVNQRLVVSVQRRLTGP